MVRYITRWALSSGIVKADGEYSGTDGKYFSSGRMFVSAKEAFATLDEAKACAKSMAVRKAANLRKKAKELSDPAWEPKVREG